MMKKLFCLLFFSFLPLIANAQPSSKATLLAANCLVSKGVCAGYELYAYHFDKGVYAGKDLILATESNKVVYNPVQNRIYRDRYVITQMGDVIDVKEKKLLFHSDGTFLRRHGDKVFVEVRTDKEEGIYSFDIISKQYALVGKLDGPMSFGVISPGGTKSALTKGFSQSTPWIEIHQYGKEPYRISGDFKMKFGPLANSSRLPKVPIYWLNDEELITLRDNGELVKVNVITKQITPFLTIKIEGVPPITPTFFEDTNGDLIYQFDRYYVIDTTNRTYKIKEESSRNGFTSVSAPNSTERAFFYDGKEIGNFPSPYWPKSTENYIAAQTDPGAVKVWNSFTGEWTVIAIRNLSSVVGLISE